MLKKLGFLIAFFVFVTGNTSTVSAQEPEFRGVFTVIYLNQPCRDEGWDLGDTATTRVTLGDVGTADNTVISYFFPFFAESYRIDGHYRDLVGGWLMTDRATFLGRNGPSNFEADIKFQYVLPLYVRPNTSSIKIKGYIKDFDAIPKCIIKFSLVANRRLD